MAYNFVCQPDSSPLRPRMLAIVNPDRDEENSKEVDDGTDLKTQEIGRRVMAEIKILRIELGFD